MGVFFAGLVPPLFAWVYFISASVLQYIYKHIYSFKHIPVHERESENCLCYRERTLNQTS